ncbi:methyltransferase domain-containing protein [Halobacillus salinus]|uniref:methyltransferase domain-containing protein n=1 Tax=Halobacillus salinus TaxID=192814 RepID=UPI0009A58984|nr:methyltransferase domain-containing protein [Halobacillus salinus]
MAMDFHDPRNIGSYRTRVADQSWRETVSSFVSFPVEKTADIGCGGGIYTKALAELGSRVVYGIDQSEVSLSDGEKTCRELSQVFFQKGQAYATGLEENSFDLVLERALVHHLDDLGQCFTEVERVLKPGGVVLVQDRTPDDCFLPGSDTHLRGHIFECFPLLKEVEKQRRYTSEQVIRALHDAGLSRVREVTLWEMRRTYSGKEELRQDLRGRIGRSILHELDDDELQYLVDYIDQQLDDGPLVEKDRWTIWIAEKGDKI